MPPRRSTRAAPVTQTVPVEKPAAKPRPAANAKKRAASPARATSPAPKRQRSAEINSENDPPAEVRGRKPSSKAPVSKKGADATVKKPAKLSPIREKQAPAAHVQKKPYFNPLPTPPQKQRPGLVPFVWGTGNFGQFGMGANVLGELPKPKRNTWAEEQMEDNVFGDDHAGIEYVSSGGLHTVFIDEKGTIWTCGVNDDAALGRITKDVPDPNNPGTFLNVDELSSVPHPLQTLVDENFRAVKVAAGDSICAAVSDQGDLRVWGSFRVNEGSLGFASGLKYQFTPVPILSLPQKVGDWEKVSSIASGGNHLLVLTTHGNIYTWGAGEQSQLGRKVIERRKIHGTVPEKIILGNRSRKAVLVGAGAFHSFAVDDRGDVWGWGLNTMGQTGTGYSNSVDSIVDLPKKVVGLGKEELEGDVVVQIEGGTHHTLFLTSGGKVYAVGRSNSGQLGLAEDHEALKDRPEADEDFIAEPALVAFPDPDDPVVQISCGSHNGAAVTRAGALYSWGQGVQGELGLGDEEEVRTPHVVVRKEGGSWFAAMVACGGQHTVGLFRKKT